MIVFTRIDDSEYDGLDLNSYVQANRINELNELVRKCNRNYLGINNRLPENDDKKIQFRQNFLQMTKNTIAKTMEEFIQLISLKQVKNITKLRKNVLWK